MSRWLVLVALAACGRSGFEVGPSRQCPPELADRDTAAGTGSVDDPYRMCSATQLVELVARTDVSTATLDVLADIDFTGVPFAGIGTAAAPFTGRIRGNGHTISNLEVVAPPDGPAGFVNAARFAQIEDLRLEGIRVTGSSEVGAVVGACDRSRVHGARVLDASVTGDASVGGLVGSAYQCQFIDASFTGTVIGTAAAVGGIVGDAGSSTFMRIDARVDVSAPSAEGVAGIVGYDSWNPVIVQDVTVEGTVTGNEGVGGLVGVNADGSQIYRSHFAGSVTGVTAVGGFAGANYDSPFHVYATSVAAEVTGNQGVGGLSGWHYYRTKFFDSYFTGRLVGVGANQSGFGGFFGDVEYYGWVERSYVDVTIQSEASTVGGVVGRIGYWSADALTYDVARSFAIAHVTGSSPSATVSRWVGQNLDPNPLVGAGSHVWSGGTCTNLGGGGCGAGGVEIADRASFELPGATPTAGWDFTRVWEARPGALPALRGSTTSSPPVMTHACTRTAIYGLEYACSPTVSDPDLNETQVALLDRAHSCWWLSPQPLTLSGRPMAGADPSCVASFAVTDGRNTSAVETFAIDVYAGVVMTPTFPDYMAQYFFGSTAVGTELTQVFTVTNREASTVTDVAVVIPSGDFRFAGGTYPGTQGTCGTTLAPGATCTVEIVFRPSAPTYVSHAIEIQFAAGRGVARYPFTLIGYGS